MTPDLNARKLLLCAALVLLRATGWTEGACSDTQADCFPPPRNYSPGAVATASRTCGVGKYGGETYGFGGLASGSSGPNSTAVCNGTATSHPAESHPAGFSNDRLASTWWQAPFAEQNVSVQLDWPNRILFQSTTLTFRSIPPAAVRLDYSTDSGASWTPYHYAAINCTDAFSLPATSEAPAPVGTGAICNSDGLLLAGGQEDGQMLTFDANARLGSSRFSNRSLVERYLWISNLRATFLQFNFVQTQVVPAAEQTTFSRSSVHGSRFYYGVYEWNVSATCNCFGHSNECVHQSGDTPGYPSGCNCSHNTAGQNCQRCLPLYSERTWLPGSDQLANECQERKAVKSTATQSSYSPSPAAGVTTLNREGVATAEGRYAENKTCFVGDGQSYIGSRMQTDFGLLCKSWDSMLGTQIKPTFPAGDKQPNNFCRNPVADPLLNRIRPWCFTETSLSGWQYCSVPHCGETINELRPMGHCESLSLSTRFCRAVYGDDAKVFIAEGSDQRGLNSLVELLFTFSKNAFYRQACLELSKYTLCHLYLPRCDNESVPVRICREDCNTLVTVCHAEWAFSVSSSVDLNLQVVLPPCYGLPSAENQTGYYRCNYAGLVLNETANCYRDTPALDYNGKVNTTTTGKSCIAWADVPAFQSRLPNRLQYVFVLANASNYCRDLEERTRPWCVTSYIRDENSTDYEWEYCDVPDCSQNPNATAAARSSDLVLTLAIVLPCSVVVSVAITLLAQCLFVGKRKQKVYPMQSSWDGLDKNAAELQPQPAKQTHWHLSPSHTRLARHRTSDASTTLLTLHSSSSISALARRATLQLGGLPALLSQSTHINDPAMEEEHRQKLDELSAKLREKNVDARSVFIQKMIGEGEFSRVFSADLREERGNQTRRIAVKCAKETNLKESITALLEEAVRMSPLRHPHVMWMEGICLETGNAMTAACVPTLPNAPEAGGPTAELSPDTASHVLSTVLHDLQQSPLMLLPLMELGDLASLLRSARSSPPTIPSWLTNHRLVTMAVEIADGMNYLSSQNCVHRDLAARNCLVRQNYSIVISDFGLSRAMAEDSYYRQQRNTRMPVKWMAPESLHDRVFTRQSDVWAFGITIWEVFSLARSPYPGITNFAVPGYLSSGGRLDRPALCPPEIYDEMQSCWLSEPRERPVMAKLHMSLSQMLLHYSAASEAGSRLGLAQANTPVDDYVEMMALTPQGIEQTLAHLIEEDEQEDKQQEEQEEEEEEEEEY